MTHPKGVRASRFASFAVAATLPFFAGCGHDHASHGHGHVHVAPRGGVLVELGDHQGNLELLLDPAEGRLSVWSLDAHAENPVRLSAPSIELVVERVDGRDVARRSLALMPVASVLSGETVGDTSEYGVTDPAFTGARAFEGRIPEIHHRGAVYRDVRVAYTHPASETR